MMKAQSDRSLTTSDSYRPCSTKTGSKLKIENFLLANFSFFPSPRFGHLVACFDCQMMSSPLVFIASGINILRIELGEAVKDVKMQIASIVSINRQGPCLGLRRKDLQ